MFISEKINEAVKNYGLLEILYYVKHDMGIDYKLDLHNDKDRIGVSFKLHNKEHYMILDDIIFDDDLDSWIKFDLIMDELMYYFGLECSPSLEFKKALEKEFILYEANDYEHIEVKIFGINKVKVAFIDEELGERREIGEWFIEEDITYENARDLAYKVAREMLEEYWGRKYK